MPQGLSLTCPSLPSLVFGIPFVQLVVKPCDSATHAHVEIRPFRPPQMLLRLVSGFQPSNKDFEHCLPSIFAQQEIAMSAMVHLLPTKYSDLVS